MLETLWRKIPEDTKFIIHEAKDKLTFYWTTSRRDYGRTVPLSELQENADKLPKRVKDRLRIYLKEEISLNDKRTEACLQALGYLEAIPP